MSASSYNGGATPMRDGAAEKFRNLRAESYWNLRRRLERGEIALPSDDKLLDELFAMDELRARIGRSPDRADAVAMAFAAADFKTRWPVWW